jgi:hypothetical protein
MHKKKKPTSKMFHKNESNVGMSHSSCARLDHIQKTNRRAGKVKYEG